LNESLFSFRPERVLFPPGGVNLRLCLCGVPVYASAQTLNFLARRKNLRFPIWKPTVSRPEFPDGNNLNTALDIMNKKMGTAEAVPTISQLM